MYALSAPLSTPESQLRGFLPRTRRNETRPPPAWAWQGYHFARGFVTLRAMIVTIDGPAGSGKSTAARGLAKALGVAYLDTGATYRAVTLKALCEGADLSDASALADLARGMDLKLAPADESLRVELDGLDVSDAIRSAEVSDNAHHVARPAQVREVLVALQRRIGAELGDFVTEGRDQGSAVFPEADVKFYLDADPEVRARRRCAEMAARGEPADYAQVLRAIRRRDERDRSRAADPLVRPRGAVSIDTSDMTVSEMIAEMRRRVEGAR